MGYIASDLTGNRIVDLTDLLLVFNNASNFVVRKSPPGSSPVSVVYDSRSLYEQRMKVINENRVQEDEFPGVRKDEGYKNQEKILKK
ncbi:MAG: hypothetical protein IPL53_05630 [Ignavibacteria bacterium]|nr:hypothetical protein [Ignavibacteria bacterium]